MALTLDDPFWSQTARGFTPPTTTVGTVYLNRSRVTSTKGAWEGPLGFVSSLKSLRSMIVSNSDSENELFTLGTDFPDSLSSELWGEIDGLSEPLSCRENAHLAAQCLSLSKSDLAVVFGVTRPTIYNWLNGTEPEDPRHHRKLSLLGAIAKEVSRTTLRPIYKGFVHDPMPGESNSLISQLRLEPWDESELRRLFIKARALTSQRDERLGTYSTPSLEEEERNLLENQLSLDKG